MSKKVCTFLIFIIPFLIIGGCATTNRGNESSTNFLMESSQEGNSIIEEIPLVQFREFVLSPGDEISITILDHEELNKRVVIPPDGIFFFPLVGEIDAKNKTIKELRETISKGLSGYHDFTISPGDEISISVYRNEDLNKKFIIPPDQRFFYPLVGEIDTKGKTPSQIREIITSELSKNVIDPQVSVDILKQGKTKIIVDPQVSIEVIRLSSQKVYVLGEVNRPGVFPVDGRLSVIEAISMAGGFTLDAKQGNVLVIRGGLKKSEIMKIDVKDFLKDADITQNISLQRGDIVYVPASTVANVDRFFRHLATIIRPIVDIETGIVLEPRVEDTFRNKTEAGGTTVIVPPR